MLVEHCYECHSSGSSEVKGSLLLDFRDGLRKGGESGPAIVPGKPAASLLLEAMRYESFEMPPAGKLSERVIADFSRWIRDGAKDPRVKRPSPTEAAEATWKAKLAQRSRWWSLQPLKQVSPPDVNAAAWAREPIDRFIRGSLDQAGLSPAPPADAETLLRRLSLVLTGLPPRPEQVESFSQAFAHDADAAVASLVDELLASPHFGERFARHWMDVVRYTDTYGYEWDNPAKGSWEYRDYLIRAFNDDVGFDQLIREQLAGDLLPESRINRDAGVNESLIGPMFYHMGEHRHGTSLEFNGIHQEMVNNKIDAFSKAFLAMTVACARCHNHKLDAISQADYYALAGVFMSPRWTSRVIDAPGKHDAEIGELKRLRKEIRERLAPRWRSAIDGQALRSWVREKRDALKKVPIENVAYPLAQLDGISDETVADVWSKLAEGWKSARNARAAANAKKYTLITDFQQPGFPDGWVVEGEGIAHGYVDSGTPLISLNGGRLVRQLLPRGYHTHALSSKLPGAVRLPPQHSMAGRFVSLKLAGGEWAGYITIPQNAFQSESVTFLDADAGERWVAFADQELTNGVTKMRTEVATSSLNPNFPPRTDKARAGGKTLPASDPGFNKRSWFSLTGIVAHEAGGAPAETLDPFASLYQGKAPATAHEAWQRVADWCQGAVDRWADGTTLPGDVPLLNGLLRADLLPNDAQRAPQAAALVQRYREVESRIAFARTANSMDERGIKPIDYRLNVRGNVDEDGPAIPRDFLQVFAGQHRVGEGSGSGRLELAEYLASRRSPQAARVYVNRVWQWIFGTGIVATPNDFGKLGGRPSHPELLDWLAAQFMEEGWSTKRLVRRLVLSRTFRQSGKVSPAGRELDPRDRLLHHYPLRRLEAEAIRDSLLAVSGSLDRQRYGPPIKPPRPVEDAKKRLFSGPLDGNGRRSLYLEMSIMAPPTFLVSFNLPDLKLPTGRRDVTNVPAQALVLLNDPFVVQAAEHWAERLMKDGSRTPQQRVRGMFLQALGRPPKDRELTRWVNAAGSFSQGELMSDQQAWAELAHALFNTKEFIYYR